MAVKINGNGSFVPDDGLVDWVTGTSANGMSAGEKAVYKTAGGNYEICDGSELSIKDFAGITDGAAVAVGGSVRLMPPGGRIAPLTAAFGAGVTSLWAKQDGSLAVFTGVGTGNYTRQVATCSETGGNAILVGGCGPVLYKS